MPAVQRGREAVPPGGLAFSRRRFTVGGTSCGGLREEVVLLWRVEVHVRLDRPAADQRAGGRRARRRRASHAAPRSRARVGAVPGKVPGLAAVEAIPVAPAAATASASALSSAASAPVVAASAPVVASGAALVREAASSSAPLVEARRARRGRRGRLAERLERAQRRDACVSGKEVGLELWLEGGRNLGVELGRVPGGEGGRGKGLGEGGGGSTRLAAPLALSRSLGGAAGAG